MTSSEYIHKTNLGVYEKWASSNIAASNIFCKKEKEEEEKRIHISKKFFLAQSLINKVGGWRKVSHQTQQQRQQKQHSIFENDRRLPPRFGETCCVQKMYGYICTYAWIIYMPYVRIHMICSSRLQHRCTNPSAKSLSSRENNFSHYQPPLHPSTP